MGSIKIFITHTPNKTNKLVENSVVENIVAGAVFQNKDTKLKGDNTGDNISAKNKSYCEITTQYWAWKNTDYDYYGFCHYRRLFSFSPYALPESDWGTIEYDNLTDNALKELCFDEAQISRKAQKYDFLIAKGIKIETLRATSVRNHYDNAPELYIEDFELMMDIVKEKYPDIFPFAQKYADGDIYYPCNMFIMKKDIFDEYSEFLFDILEEFEKRADMSNYCVQSFRTTGHLAERLLGIYYLYVQSVNKNIKTGELQIALFKNTLPQAELVSDSKAAVSVVLAADNNYSPYLATSIASCISNTSIENNYRFVVLHRDISQDNQNLITGLAQNKDNVHIEFVNILPMVYEYTLNAREHISTETFYRFLILDIMKDCEKVIYIDCDLIVCDDIAKLYKQNMGDNLIAAVRDADFTGQLNMPGSTALEYAKNVLRLDNPYDYFQAGVIMLNIPEMRKITSVNELLNIADKDLYRYSDQDILNVLCQGRVHFLDMEWNHIFDCNGERVKNVITWAPACVNEAYMKARLNPKIIHYAGWLKPWNKPEEEFAPSFWKYAKLTPYYEVMLHRMMLTEISNIERLERVERVERVVEKVTEKVIEKVPEPPKKLSLKSKILYFFLPDGSERRNKARAWYYKHIGVPQK